MYILRLILFKRFFKCCQWRKIHNIGGKLFQTFATRSLKMFQHLKDRPSVTPSPPSRARLSCERSTTTTTTPHCRRRSTLTPDGTIPTQSDWSLTSPSRRISVSGLSWVMLMRQHLARSRNRPLAATDEKTRKVFSVFRFWFLWSVGTISGDH